MITDLLLDVRKLQSADRGSDLGAAIRNHNDAVERFNKKYFFSYREKMMWRKPDGRLAKLFLSPIAAEPSGAGAGGAGGASAAAGADSL